MGKMVNKKFTEEETQTVNIHLQRWSSTSPIIMKTQIRIENRPFYTYQIGKISVWQYYIHSDKNVGKQELTYTVDENINLYNYLEEQFSNI